MEYTCSTGTFFSRAMGANSGGSIIVAGDGYAYVGYGYAEYNINCPNQSFISHVRLLRIGTDGSYSKITIQDVTAPLPGGITPQQDQVTVNMISNADTGVLLSWSAGWFGDDYTVPPQLGMAITTGTSLSPISAPAVPGQSAVVPVLQVQDGSFVGTFIDSGTGQTNMIAFDATGAVRWSVANEQPKIATQDGGVIAQSGTTYDQSGSATGLSNLNANVSPGWLGNVLGTAYSLNSGALFSVAAPNTNYATTFAAFVGGNASGQGTAIDWIMSKWSPTNLLKQLPDVVVPACWPGPIIAPFGFLPTCGNINAIELLTTQSPDSIFQNFIQTFAPVTRPGLNQPSPNSVMTFAGGLSFSNPVNVTGPGQILTITLKGFPSLPFAVMTERFDPLAHIISVVTLKGHPLAGWRYWRVYSIGTNDVVIETGGYDQPGPGFAFYAGYYIFQGTVKKGWMQYLQNIQSRLVAPQGSHLNNSLGGISLRSFPSGSGPLLNGYWDYFGDFTNYILNNVCQSTTCN